MECKFTPDRCFNRAHRAVQIREVAALEAAERDVSHTAPDTVVRKRDAARVGRDTESAVLAVDGITETDLFQIFIVGVVVRFRDLHDPDV